MAIDHPATHNLVIRRGRGYSKTFSLPGDFSAYTAKSEIRSSRKATSTLIETFTCVVGSYSGGRTPVTLSLSASETAAVTADTGHWDLVLTSGGVPETYIIGSVSFEDAPTVIP